MFAGCRSTSHACNANPKKASPVSVRHTKSPLVARKSAACTCGGTCPRCRAGQVHSHDHQLGTLAPQIVHDVLRAPGRPLDPEVRASMEERFGGCDFGAVRVHADAQADASARAVNSVAYTVGSHVAFTAGRYDPHSDVGRRTLAHELTHVVQQSGASPRGSLEIGKADDAREREADRVAASAISSRAVGHISADHGVQMLRRQDDATVEAGTGAGTGITDGTLTEVAGVHGTTFDATFCFSALNCDVHFKFEKAYKGTYPYGAAGGRTVRGVYVKIKMSAEPECGRCSTLEVVQILRNTRRSARGVTQAADPGTDIRRARSGWGDGNAPSRGWRVDVLQDATDPFYSHQWVGQAGTATTPAILWDTPGDWSTDRNAGKDFQSCLICVEGGRRTTLGCVNWGYYINGSGAISFTPATPVATCGSNVELRDAATRWEGIQGNAPLNLEQHTAPRPLGDFPVPTGDTRVA